MKTTLKPIAIASTFAALMCLADAPVAPRALGFFAEASAGVVVAPVRRAAVVTTVAVASTSANSTAAANANAAAAANANATAAATANANAAAANANAATAASKAAPAAPAAPAVGSMTTTLPAGCAPTKLNDVDYQRCGSTYYKAQMQGNNLVYVVAQP